MYFKNKIKKLPLKIKKNRLKSNCVKVLSIQKSQIYQVHIYCVTNEPIPDTSHIES